MRKLTGWAKFWPVLSLFIPMAANAAIAWDESVSGDLSNNGLAPTPVSMGLGSNTVVGTVGNAGAGIDRDYFTFTVPQGAELTAITVLPNSRPAGVSFIGLEVGPKVTVSTVGYVGAGDLWGWVHFGASDIGTNILPAMPNTYTGPLGSGTYSIWVQETGGTVPYGFDFSITPVAVNTSDGPLPPWSILALGGGLVGIAAWKRRVSR